MYNTIILDYKIFFFCTNWKKKMFWSKQQLQLNHQWWTFCINPRNTTLRAAQWEDSVMFLSHLSANLVKYLEKLNIPEMKAWQHDLKLFMIQNLTWSSKKSYFLHRNIALKSWEWNNKIKCMMDKLHRSPEARLCLW